MEGDSGNNNSGWGAFKRSKDAHGDSGRSFSIFTIFFILLALLGIGYYTYLQVSGATFITARPLTVDINSGLVGHWTFDASSLTSATATDMSFNGNDGTLVASPSSVIGRLGQALSFNGSSQYVNVDNKNLIDGTSAASVCLWLKYDPVTVSADDQSVDFSVRCVQDS